MINKTGERLVYSKHSYSKMLEHQIDLSEVVLSMITNGALLSQFAKHFTDVKELELFISMNATTSESYAPTR